MSEIDAKVNMSLDEIIKMESKKNRKGKMTGVKGIRGAAKGNAKGQATQGKRSVQRNKKNVNTFKRQGKVQGGFIKKRNATNGVTRQKGNALNRGLQRSNAKSNISARRLNTSMSRNKFSRSNLSFTQNKMNGKRTTSMPNLRDPDSVHNRLGYQTPAQIAYRNKIKRAKQLLIQNQKLNIQNNLRSRANQAVKPLTTLQRALELRQQAMLPQRGYSNSGLRSDFILRAQRRAQYEEKLMRIKAAQMSSQSLKLAYPKAQRSINTWFSGIKTPSIDNTLPQLSRGRSPFRQTMQTMRAQSFNRQRRSRSRSRSRAIHRNISLSNDDLEDRTFSEVMYSLSGGLGVTDKTLNERFSY